MNQSSDLQSSLTLRLSRKQTEAWYFLQDNKTTELIYGGGAGGGKSYLGCIWHVVRRVNLPGSRGLIGRSKISNLEQSTLVTLFNVAQKMGYQIGKDFNYNSQKHVINWANGSQTILKDLFLYPSDPDFISLGSTEYTDAFVDEANEITEKAFDILNSRIRYRLSDYETIPKILLTCNPAPGWLKDKYISKDAKLIDLEPYQKVVKALVSDNPDEEFVRIYATQLDRMSSPYDKARLLYGDWEVDRESKHPFAYQFDRDHHISDRALFNEGKRIIMSIDFNLQPFACVFSHIWEDADGVHDHTFDEIEIPQGSIQAMADEIKMRYKAHLHKFEITGDYMGNRGDISQRDNASLYLQLCKELGISKHQLKLSPNPTHENSKADVNYVLWKAKSEKKCEFIINPTCKGSIFDFQSVQWDNLKQQIVKKDRSNKDQQADRLDCHRYKINHYWKKYILR